MLPSPTPTAVASPQPLLMSSDDYANVAARTSIATHGASPLPNKIHDLPRHEAPQAQDRLRKLLIQTWYGNDMKACSMQEMIVDCNVHTPTSPCPLGSEDQASVNSPAIQPSANTPVATLVPRQDSGGSGGLSQSAEVGIIIVVVLVVLIFGACLWCWCRSEGFDGDGWVAPLPEPTQPPQEHHSSTKSKQPLPGGASTPSTAGPHELLTPRTSKPTASSTRSEGGDRYVTASEGDSRKHPVLKPRKK